MKVYIAGKITGDPDYKDKFAEYEALERRRGNIVLNPAVLPEGMHSADYIRICFAMIDTADVVRLLPDWRFSFGAKLEKQYCDYIAKPTELYPTEPEFPRNYMGVWE